MSFPSLCEVASDKEAWAVDVWGRGSEWGGWAQPSLEPSMIES